MQHTTTTSRQWMAGFALSITGVCGAAHADHGLEGAAGGGVTPWALIGSSATALETSTNAVGYFSNPKLRDYRLRTYGAPIGIRDRLELTLAQQDPNAPSTIALQGIAPFGTAPSEAIRMQILGLKVRIAGDAVLTSEALMPQISVGMQYRTVNPGAMGTMLSHLGTKRSGTDIYLSATKLFLAQGLLVNATVRAAKADHGTPLGFGAAVPGRSNYSVQPEFSVAYLLSRDIAIGAQYRFKSKGMEATARSASLGDALREDDWKDLFIAWAPSKNLSLTLAYVDLGRMAPGVPMNRRQSGGYISAQFSF
jgi:Protein of unknown function (DUF3034)